MAGIAQASEAPRIWHFTRTVPGGLVQGYILAITHVGLPVEYDGDLQRVILPAAARSEKLFYEGAGPAQELGSQPNCENPFKEPEDIQVLKNERARAAELRFEFYRNLRDRKITYQGQTDEGIRNVSAAMANTLSEADLISAFRLFGRQPYLAGSDTTLHGSVVKELTKKFPAGQVFDIDEPFAYAKAYCRLEEKVRVDFLQKALRGLDADLAAADKGSTDVALDKLQADFQNTLKQQTLVGDLVDEPAVYRSFVCERNRAWMRRIGDQAPGTTNFYAVGIAHIYPQSAAPAGCQGLLKDLQSAGYKLSALD